MKGFVIIVLLILFSAGVAAQPDTNSSEEINISIGLNQSNETNQSLSLNCTGPNSTNCSVWNGTNVSILAPLPNTINVTKEWDWIKSGEDSSLFIYNENISIAEVRIMVNNDTLSPSLKVTRFYDKPNITKPYGKVYQYLEINQSNLSDTLSMVTISFSVKSSWILNNSIVPSSIYMYKYEDNEWKRLDTILVSTGKDHVYTSQTNGLSFFSIAGTVVGQVCDDGEMRCNGNIVESCNITAWEQVELCQYRCLNSICMDKVCETDDFRCNGDMLERCDTIGWSQIEICDYGCNDYSGVCNPFIDWNLVGDVLLIIIAVVGLGLLLKYVKKLRKRMKKPKTTGEALKWRPE